MTSLHRRWRAAIAGTLLIATSMALACGARRETSDISQSEVETRLGSAHPPLMLDVRTPAEFSTGHVPGAVNIPIDTLGKRMNEIDDRRGEEVVVYCERGPRATKAAAMLGEAGFSAVRHLTGDMAGWRAAGLPIAK
jgi:phage shock protein E